MYEIKELNDAEMEQAAGGSLRDHPKYDEIKEFYRTRGSASTVTLCSYYYHFKYNEIEEMLLLIQDDLSQGAGRMTENIFNF